MLKKVGVAGAAGIGGVYGLTTLAAGEASAQIEMEFVGWDDETPIRPDERVSRVRIQGNPLGEYEVPDGNVQYVRFEGTLTDDAGEIELTDAVEVGRERVDLDPESDEVGAELHFHVTEESALSTDDFTPTEENPETVHDFTGEVTFSVFEAGASSPVVTAKGSASGVVRFVLAEDGTETETSTENESGAGGGGGGNATAAVGGNFATHVGIEDAESG